MPQGLSHTTGSFGSSGSAGGMGMPSAAAASARRRRRRRVGQVRVVRAEERRQGHGLREGRRRRGPEGRRRRRGLDRAAERLDDLGEARVAVARVHGVVAAVGHERDDVVAVDAVDPDALRRADALEERRADLRRRLLPELEQERAVERRRHEAPRDAHGHGDADHELAVLHLAARHLVVQVAQLLRDVLELAVVEVGVHRVLRLAREPRDGLAEARREHGHVDRREHGGDRAQRRLEVQLARRRLLLLRLLFLPSSSSSAAGEHGFSALLEALS